jgi:hypothetical protein
MDSKIRCKHCRRLFRPDPRVKNQCYCSEKPCQRARKNLWQKQKLHKDPDYQANQKRCQQQWRKKNPHYWQDYRKDNPKYVKRNRLLQKCRDKNRSSLPVVANMDASETFSCVKPGPYYLLPVLANMDVSIQKVVLIPAT